MRAQHKSSADAATDRLGAPVTPKALWERVRYWREQLANSSQYPVLDGLEASWKGLDAFYEGIIKRTDDAKTSSTPLSSLCFHVESGFYPPPEILLAVCDSFYLYANARGALTLEEAFFGPPKRKAGNYARRSAAGFQRNWLQWEIHRLTRDGHTKSEAAEILSRTLGGTPEPETIERMTRTRLWNRKKK